MSHSLPPPPLGPSSEQFTRVTWSVPDSNDTSISGVIAYVIPRVRACILSIPKQLVPAPVWWTYERHRQRFSEEQREQMTMLGEAIAQFAILLTARDVKPTIQDEERNVRGYSAFLTVQIDQTASRLCFPLLQAPHLQKVSSPISTTKVLRAFTSTSDGPQRGSPTTNMP